MKKIKLIFFLMAGLIFTTMPIIAYGLSGIKDSAITREIETKIHDDPELENLNIEVKTLHLEVFLRGRVMSSEQLNKILSIAKNTDGVLGVKDNLQIKKPVR